MELERAVGRLEEGFKSVKQDVSEMKGDMKLLLAWRWKLFGVTAAITVVGSGTFQLLLIFIKYLNQ